MDTLKACLQNRNKARMSEMASIQHCSGGLCQRNQTRKTKEGYEKQEENLSSLADDTTIYRKVQKNIQITRTDKRIQQSAEQRNQSESCVSTYQQQMKNKQFKDYNSMKKYKENKINLTKVYGTHI